MMTPLDQALGSLLHARWRGGNRATARAAFEKALADDPQLRADAAARKAELEILDDAQHCHGQLVRRCAVSAVHLDELRWALDPKRVKGMSHG